VSPAGWVCCVAWLALALGVSAWFGLRADAEERRRARARITSPTVYLFAAYLVVAGFVATPGDRGGGWPLYGLAVALPALYAAATFAAIGVRRAGFAPRALVAALYGGAALAAGAVVIAAAAPEFVPPWLR
jgi:cytochrome bd-type quinol oxidase subunit 2